MIAVSSNQMRLGPGGLTTSITMFDDKRLCYDDNRIRYQKQRMKRFLILTGTAEAPKL